MEKLRPRDALARLVAPYRGLGPSLWSMFFATMINRFGDFVAPFLSLYLSRSLGYDAGRTGVVVAIVFGASTAGSLLSGRLADALGRKRTLLACQVAAALVNLAVSFLFDRAWAPWLLVAGNLFRGGARPLIGALLTDLAPPERRKEVFGLQYWSINVGVAVGPLVAGVLFDRALPWLFRGDAICALLSVSLIAFRVRVADGSGAAATSLERHDSRGALRAFVARPVLLAFSALALANSLTYSQTGFALPMTVSAALGEAGPRFVGYLMSLNAVLVIALSIPLARLLRSRRPLACMAISGGFYVAGFGVLALAPSRGLFLASTAVWTVGEIISSVNMGVFLAKHSPANWRGSFQSFMGGFFSAGWSIGPLLAGGILDRAGAPGLWLAVAGLCALWTAGAYVVDRWDGRIQPEG